MSKSNRFRAIVQDGAIKELKSVLDSVNTRILIFFKVVFNSMFQYDNSIISTRRAYSSSASTDVVIRRHFDENEPNIEQFTD